MLKSFFFFITLSFATAGLAQTPLAAGDDVPSNFKLIDSLGREQTFLSLKGNHGLVLLFTRSADWCQYCKAQLRDWNEHVEALKEQGYKLAAVSYDAPTKLAEFEQKNQLRYPLLSDEGSAMIKAFGIRNEKFDEGSRFYGIPNPAIYIIDETSTITHVMREEDYKDRPTPEAVIDAISGEPETTESEQPITQ